MGIKIRDKRPDVNLVFVKGIKKKCVNILRLDNAWINSDVNSSSLNRKIKKVMNKCDGVIYQNRYSKKVCDKFIGKHNKSGQIAAGNGY